MLKNSAAIGAGCAFLMSNPEPADVPKVFTKMMERCANEPGRIMNKATEGRSTPDATFARPEDTEKFYLNTCAEMKRCFDEGEYEAHVNGFGTMELIHEFVRLLTKYGLVEVVI